MMNYVPLFTFLLAVAWIVRQGYASKKKYQRDGKSQNS
jgi:hypothetical protein